MLYLTKKQKQLLKYYIKDVSLNLAVDNWNEAERVIDAAVADENLPKSCLQFLYTITDAYFYANGFLDIY